MIEFWNVEADPIASRQSVPRIERLAKKMRELAGRIFFCQADERNGTVTGHATGAVIQLAAGFSIVLYIGFWFAAPAFTSLAGSAQATGVVRLLTVVIVIDGIAAHMVPWTEMMKARSSSSWTPIMKVGAG